MASLEEAQQAMRMRRYRDAYEAYSSLLATDSPKASILAGMSTCLYYLRRYEEAAEKAQAALDIRENLAQPHLILAYVLDRKGNPVEALVHALRAVELEPDMPEALQYAGAMLIVKGDQMGGVPLVERSIHLEPNMWNAHAMLGHAHAVRGELRPARSEFWLAFRLRPSAVTLNALVAAHLRSYGLWIVFILLVAAFVGFWLRLFWLPVAVAGIEILAGLLQILAGDRRRGASLVLTAAFLLLVTIILAQQ
jgi:tetratricopeptide (TPR) repeat protein